MALFVGLLALLLAGCGANDEKPVASTVAKAGTRPDAPPARVAHGARDALIRLADLSSSWQPAPRIATGLECAGWDPLAGARQRTGSPRFHRESQDVQQTLGLFADEAASGRAFQRLNAPRTERCVRRALRRRLRFFSGAGIAYVAPVRTVLVEALGEHSKAFRYATEVNAELGKHEPYIVEINTRVGPAVASLIVISGLAPFAEAAYDQLAERAERRLTAAFG